ncbi:uncharacterized protein [Typha latifolia]|uniref:uncharacterized protein isoform X3 n=1 Tax=Typha latifolia TaxID=4733 RepID=UPI003C2E1A6B
MEERKGRGRRMQGGKSSGTIATATSLSKSWSSSQAPVMGSRFGIMQLLVVLNFAVAWVAKGLTRRSNTNIIKVPKWMKSFGEIIYYPKISIMLVGGSVLITNKPLSYGYGMTGVEHSGNEDIQPLLSNIEPFV